MHMDIMDMSQEPLGMEIYRTMPNAPDTTSFKVRALTVTVRTPECDHTVWWIKMRESGDLFNLAISLHVVP